MIELQERRPLAGVAPPCGAVHDCLLIARASRAVRSRRKGDRLPEDVIYVGRPTLWDNLFKTANRGHKEWLRGHLGALTLERMGHCPAEIDALWRLRIRVLTNLHRLAGHDLACWCPLTSEWCHAQTLLDLAPQYREYESWAA